MPNIFLISDTHFGHASICKFVTEDGSKVRPWDNPQDMDDFMIEKWNHTVRPKDKIYHLGDVAINRNCLKILEKLNGEKVLIKGNHDIFKIKDYLQYFKDVRSFHKLDKFIITHFPIHASCIPNWMLCNFHGHTHTRRITKTDGSIDTSYFNLCVECIDYTPISFEDAKKKFFQQLGENNVK